MIIAILIALAAAEGVEQLLELRERRQGYLQAKHYADSIGKPLLVVGTPKLGFNHPCGDVTIDNNPNMARWCNTEIADIRDIPYPNQYFGAAFASHVLEHLPTEADAEKALSELHRVAEEVFIVVPRKASLMAQICPTHHLWLTANGGGFIIEERHRQLPTRGSCIKTLAISS